MGILNYITYTAPATGGGGYPWGWEPPLPHQPPPRLRPELRRRKVTRVRPKSDADRAAPNAYYFDKGGTLWAAFLWWAGQLRWAARAPTASDAAPPGISWLDLAIDFAVATGVNRPPRKVGPPRATASHNHSDFVLPLVADAYARAGVLGAARPDIRRPLWSRAAMMCSIWRRVARECDRPLAPGARANACDCRALRHLGARPQFTNWAGWDRRPRLAGGAHTEEVLRELAVRPHEWDHDAAAGEPDDSAAAPPRPGAAAPASRGTGEPSPGRRRRTTTSPPRKRPRWLLRIWRILALRLRRDWPGHADPQLGRRPAGPSTSADGSVVAGA
eukprot:gene8464-16618_t